MSPSIIGHAEFDALVVAVQPSDGELLEVKRQLVQRLSDGGAHSVSELRAGVLAAFGVPAELVAEGLIVPGGAREWVTSLTAYTRRWRLIGTASASIA